MLHAFKAFLVIDLAILAFGFVIATVHWLIGLINLELNLTTVMLAFIGLCSAYMAYRQRENDRRADADAKARILRDEELKKAADAVAKTLVEEGIKQDESRKRTAEATAKVVVAAETVKTTLANATAATDAKLTGLANVAGQQTESLREIHVAVNSTLTAAVEAEADAKKIAYLALKRVYEMQPEGAQKEADKIVMEESLAAWNKSAETVKAKASALKMGTEKEKEKEKEKVIGLSGQEIKLTIK
jgi:hypothetical protein